MGFMTLEMIRDEALLLASGRHDNPHRFLGLHELEGGEKIIRLWAPKKTELIFEYLGEQVSATLADSAGVFTYHVPRKTTPYDYRVMHADGICGYDPYAFIPTISFV